MITKCRIVQVSKFSPCQVYVTVNRNEEIFLFEFFDDEITFRESEFIGLTKSEAVELFIKRDMAYLRS